MILMSLVDEVLLGFSEWKESLINEDKELGIGVVNRTDEQLSFLYESYRKFQGSREVRQARLYYYGK